MKLRLDITQVRFMVSKAPEPKIDITTGLQRIDRFTGQPLNVTELIARVAGEGAEVIKVTTAGQPPKVQEDQFVVPHGLVAQPWAQGDRNGVAFRADVLEPVQAASSGKAA